MLIKCIRHSKVIYVISFSYYIVLLMTFSMLKKTTLTYRSFTFSVIIYGYVNYVHSSNDLCPICIFFKRISSLFTPTYLYPLYKISGFTEFNILCNTSSKHYPFEEIQVDVKSLKRKEIQTLILHSVLSNNTLLTSCLHYVIGKTSSLCNGEKTTEWCDRVL